MASSYLALGGLMPGSLWGESGSFDPPLGAIEIRKLSHTIEWEDRAERDEADRDLADSLVLEDARGEARHKTIKITKAIDPTSPALRDYCNRHKVIEKGTIHVYANNRLVPALPINREIFKIYLEHVTVESVDLDVDGDELPEETIELRYKKIAWIYQAPVVESLDNPEAAAALAAGGLRWAGWDTLHEDDTEHVPPTLMEALAGHGVARAGAGAILAAGGSVASAAKSQSSAKSQSGGQQVNNPKLVGPGPGK